MQTRIAQTGIGQVKKWVSGLYRKVGDKVRVRVGPYADRDKAEKARRLLGKHGLHAGGYERAGALRSDR